MRWHDPIFRRLGNRRLFTKSEFLRQMIVESSRPESPVVVLAKDEHEALTEIAALANIIDDCKSRKRKRVSAAVYRRLASALDSYKNPPSAIKTYEEYLMDIP